jgi:HSP20 family protein
MAIADLIPWKRERVPVRREEEEPVLSFRREMNRMFDEFFRGAGLAPFGEEWTTFQPRVDVVETDQEIKVSVELPGLDAKDVDVTVSHNTLTISGEKKEEREEKGENYYRAERSYGSFRRSVPLLRDVEADKADAVFQKGVLTITFPKTAEAKARTQITVKSK